MTLSMDKWDGMVRPLLTSIRTNAMWAKYHAVEIKNHVAELPYKPDFATEAESEIDRAIEETGAAIELLRAAKQVYHDKKVEK